MSCIFLNQFILHGNNNEFDASKKLILSHTNVFEKEWGATVGNLYVEDGDGEDITTEVTMVLATDDTSNKFEIVFNQGKSLGEEKVYFGELENAKATGPVINRQTFLLSRSTTIFTDEQENIPYKTGINTWVVFDAGVGKTIEMEFNDFGFEVGNDFTQYDRLGIQQSNDGAAWTNISVSWMQTSAETTPPYDDDYGSNTWQQSSGGWILPATMARATTLGSGNFPVKLNLNGRYVKFWFYSDNSAAASGFGWNITLKSNFFGKWQLKLLSNESLDIADNKRHRELTGDYDDTAQFAGTSGSTGPTFVSGQERVGLPGDQQADIDAGRGFQDYNVIIKCSMTGGGSPVNRTVTVRANERYIELVVRSWRDLTDRGWKIRPCWYYYMYTHFGTRIRFDNFGAWITHNGKSVYIHLHPDIIRNWLWISDRDHIDSRREEYSSFVYGLDGYGGVDRKGNYPGHHDPDVRHGFNAKSGYANQTAWDGRNEAYCSFGDEPYGNANAIKIDGHPHEVPSGTGNHSDWHEIINNDSTFWKNSGSDETCGDDERGIAPIVDRLTMHQGDRFGGCRWQGRFRWAPGRRSENTAQTAKEGSPDRVSIGSHNYYNIQDLQYIFHFDDDEKGNVEVYKDNNAYEFIDECDHSKGTQLFSGGWSVSRNNLFALLGQLKQKFGHPEDLGFEFDQSTEENAKFKRGDVWRIYPNMNFTSLKTDGGEDAVWKGRTANRAKPRPDFRKALKSNYEDLTFGLNQEGDYFFDVELILKEFDSNKYNDGNEGKLNAHDNGPTINFGQLWNYPVGTKGGEMNTYNYDWKIECGTTLAEVDVFEYDTDEDLGPDRKRKTGSTISGAEHYNGNSNMEMNMYIGNPRIVKTAEGFAEPGWLPGGEGTLKGGTNEVEENTPQEPQKEGPAK